MEKVEPWSESRRDGCEFDVSNWLNNPATSCPLNDMIACQMWIPFGTAFDYGTASKMVASEATIAALYGTDQIQHVLRSKYGRDYLIEDGKFTYELAAMKASEVLKGFGLPSLEISNNVSDGRVVWFGAERAKAA
jgi:hypothetical protein